MGRPGPSRTRRYRPWPADHLPPGRDVVDAIRCLDRTGCQWDALPADFPHHKLVYHYFKTWTRDGTLDRMRNSLREQVRAQVEGRNTQPTAAAVDSQSVRAAETVGRPSLGYDGGKKINGRKRHIAWTPAACCWRSWSPVPTHKTATAPDRCCGRSVLASPPSV
jgi:transposase